MSVPSLLGPTASVAFRLYVPTLLAVSVVVARLEAMVIHSYNVLLRKLVPTTRAVKAMQFARMASVTVLRPTLERAANVSVCTYLMYD